MPKASYDIATEWFESIGFDRGQEFTNMADEYPDYTGPEDSFFSYGDGSRHGYCLVENGVVVAGARGGESVDHGYSYFEAKVVAGLHIGATHEWECKNPNNYDDTGIMEFYNLLKHGDPYYGPAEGDDDDQA